MKEEKKSLDISNFELSLITNKKNIPTLDYATTTWKKYMLNYVQNIMRKVKMALVKAFAFGFTHL